MSQRKLKIVNPPVNAYPDYAYPLSVMLLEESSLDWFYSNFIQVYHLIEDNSCSVNFYYSDINNRLWDTRFPLLDYQIIHKDIVDKLNIDIIDVIKTIIDTENYCYLYLDEFYLPTSRTFNEYHFLHIEFIYGYDLVKNVFYMAGYDKNLQYNYYEHTFDDFRKAYYGCKRDYYNDKNNIYVFKYNYTGSIYSFDFNAVCCQVEEYLYSKNSSLRYNNCFNPRPNMTYGIDVINEVRKDIINYKMDNTKYVDLRPFCILKEHKTLMVSRLEYMLKKNYINDDLKCIYLFKKLENEYKDIINLMIKFRLTKNITIIDKVYDKLGYTYQFELEAFEKFLALL